MKPVAAMMRRLPHLFLIERDATRWKNQNRDYQEVFIGAATRRRYLRSAMSVRPPSCSDRTQTSRCRPYLPRQQCRRECPARHCDESLIAGPCSSICKHCKLIFVIDAIRATFARSQRPPVRVADRRLGFGPSCRRSPFFQTIQCWAQAMASAHRYRSGTRCSAGGERGQPSACGASGQLL